MPFENLLRCLRHIDRLPIATDKSEHGALAVARHAADERDVIWMGCPVSNLVHSIQKRMAVSLDFLR
jgi:hypothetical protein